MSIDQYYLLGGSGLRVSRIALGTMTFGTAGRECSWGSEEKTARAIFDRYIASGGNFIDTADLYTEGMSETMLGSFIADAGIRDRLVLATKFSYNITPSDPNAGGNGRKNMIRAVESSLRRLRTDYIDLYLVHTWDRITPVEEVMRTLDDLARSGKIRYAGMSDVPGWYAARAQTYAEAHAMIPLINLQLPYSLVERDIEREFVPLGLALGMGITAWSPLGMGLLSGKYRPGAEGAEGSGRLTMNAAGVDLGLFNERNWRVVATLEGVAHEIGRSMAQVALNWAATQPGIGSVIIGASNERQLDDNLAALDFAIPEELRLRLDEASTPTRPHPYSMFTDAYQTGRMNAGMAIADKPRGYAPTVGI